MNQEQTETLLKQHCSITLTIALVPISALGVQTSQIRGFELVQFFGGKKRQVSLPIKRSKVPVLSGPPTFFENFNVK